MARGCPSNPAVLPSVCAACYRSVCVYNPNHHYYVRHMIANRDYGPGCGWIH